MVHKYVCMVLIFVNFSKLHGADQESQQSIEDKSPALFKSVENENHRKSLVAQSVSPYQDEINAILKEKKLLEDVNAPQSVTLNETESDSDIDARKHSYRPELNSEKHIGEYKENYEPLFDFTRLYNESYRHGGDCLFYSRKRVVPFPGDCYEKTYKENRLNVFWPFWGQWFGDIMYAFDFVLYDDIYQERKENQFWYLIAYLRIITLEHENPMKIVNSIKRDIKFSNTLNQFQAEIRKIQSRESKITSNCELLG